MLYLFWALLNIGLFTFFLSICFNATKFIKQRFGVLTAIVFVFGLLSFVGRSNYNSEHNNQGSERKGVWKFTSSDTLDKSSNFHIDIDLEKTLISKYSLGIEYGRDKYLQSNIPVSAHVWVTGFVSGTSWRPGSIFVSRTEDNQKFEYQVDGVIEWSLLGMTIYSQPKKWKGVAVLE